MKHRFTASCLLVLAFASAAGGIAPVKAEEPSSPPKGVYLTQNLLSDPNSRIPDIIYLYQFNRKSWNGAAYETLAADAMPFIPEVGMNTIQQEVHQQEIRSRYERPDGTYSDAPAADGSDLTRVTVLESTDILENIRFPRAGVYLYEVEQVHPKPADEPGLEVSRAEYSLAVWVANDKAEDGEKQNPGGVHVSSVAVFCTKNDAGEPMADASAPEAGLEGAGLGAKTDASEGTGLTGLGSRFAYQSVYTGLDRLWIGKALAGDYADRTAAFRFTTALHLPKSLHQEERYTALICKDGAAVKDRANTVVFEKSAGYQAQYQLMADEYLLFADAPDGSGILPIGTRYTVAEEPVSGYTLSAFVSYGDTTKTRRQDASARVEAGAVLSSNPATGSRLLVGDASRVREEPEKANQTILTGTYKSVSPTGILSDHLSAFLLISAALAGLAVSIHAQRRVRS
jgi:hypothetical protein